MFALFFIAKRAMPAQWELKGALEQALTANDNIALTAIQPQSVFGYILTPNLQASRKTATLDISLAGRGDIRRYDDSRWDCDNYDVSTNGKYQTRRSNFSLNGSYGVSCSYTQQITDTGILIPRSQSERLNLAPSWLWQLNPRSQLSTEATYSKTSYSSLGGSIATTGFSGNETYSITLGGNHLWRPDVRFNGGLYFSNIQYTGTTRARQNLYGFQLGANYLINHQWKTSGGGGLRLVDTLSRPSGTSSAGDSSLVFGYVANIDVSYEDALSNFALGYSNTLSPSGIGQTLQTQVIFAKYSYKMTQQLVLDLGGNYTHSEGIGSQNAANAFRSFNRDYSTASAGLAWSPARGWRITGSYFYRWQRYPQGENILSLIGGTAESNTVMLSVKYSWDGIRDSR